VAGVAFSPNGHDVAFLTGQKVSIWNIDGTAPPHVVGSLGVKINYVVYSPDGRHLAGAAEDSAVHIWNADGSGETTALTGHVGMIQTVEYSHDGSRIVTAGADGTVRIWRDLEPLFPNDPSLWKGTNECLSAERRRELLGIGDSLARTLYQRCQARVAAARPSDESQ
jgi:WD40 repeat protein